MIKSGLEYWPQTDGNTIQYNIFTVPAIWDISHMEIIENGTPQYQGNFLISTSFYKMGSFVSHVHSPGTLSNPINMTTSQVNALGVYDDNTFIGEIMNGLGNVIWPPEPKLSCYPVVGETFDVHSSIFNSEADYTVVIQDFHTRYKTLRFTSYPTFNDVLVTSMVEINPDGSFGWAGNYYFQRGVGIILQYGGVINSDNNTLMATKLFKNP